MSRIKWVINYLPGCSYHLTSSKMILPEIARAERDAVIDPTLFRSKVVTGIRSSYFRSPIIEQAHPACNRANKNDDSFYKIEINANTCKIWIRPLSNRTYLNTLTWWSHLKKMTHPATYPICPSAKETPYWRQ